ncbi:hypothetical protein BH09ACT10_BH09ACT10_04860 [soil metagenome]
MSSGDLPWLTLASASTTIAPDRPLKSRRVYAQVLALTILVVVIVGILGSFASRRVAEREAINDAAQRAGIFADAVIQPALANGIINQDPAAVALLSVAVRDHVLGASIVRVKVWTPDGTIVYSDEPRLVGKKFTLGKEERAVLATPATRAEVTDLDEPENVYERGQGKLLEAYRPVWTPDGHELLFETYAPYDVVLDRSGQLWRGFAGITVSSLLALIVLLLPILWRLLDRLRTAQAHREALLQRALDASDAERRRIAATLHDGVVQELAATSFTVSAAAAKAEAEGKPEMAASLEDAAATVRTGIAGLRSLLVDIYPASLVETGLVAALGDMVRGFQTRDTEIVLSAPDDFDLNLSRDDERLIFQVAQETVRNAVRHAHASRVDVILATNAHSTLLDVIDDGVGFDPAAVLALPEEGHFGMRLLVDAAAEGGAELRVASVPGRGTHWQLGLKRA